MIMSPSFRSPTFPSPRSPGSRRAFTLVEVLLAVLILGMVIVSSILLLRMGFGMIETARDQTLASQFLQSEMETLRLKNWTEISQLPATEDFTIDSDFDETAAERFACTRLVEDARPGVDVKTITIRAEWTTSNGVQRELLYSTRMAKDGLNDYYYRSL